mmetsp:Transcript_1572/g.3355  ORF Transcript_1572/g.3355 Transcript_1572/m.3355 type:complete len:245 (-) Transcript_1572:2484-3218(-)
MMGDPPSDQSTPPTRLTDYSTPEEIAAYYKHQVKEWNAIFDSAVRISLAGGGGIVAGYGIGEQRARQQQQTSTAPRQRGRPPSQLGWSYKKRTERFALARSFGFSCFLFASILEVCHLASPITALQRVVQSASSINKEPQDVDDKSQKKEAIDIAAKRKAFTSIGDFTLGGSFAGLAGSRAWARTSALTTRRGPLLVRGVINGTLLGLVIGLLQAALDVAVLYDEEREASPEDKGEGEDKGSPI